jgi:hypothetical protein
MADYRVDVSEPAENDLRDIARYISEHLLRPTAAIKTMDAFDVAFSREVPINCLYVGFRVNLLQVWSGERWD